MDGQEAIDFLQKKGKFADAANNHGYKRARWRGRTKMQIQNLMIAAIQNLRKLLGSLDHGGRAGALRRVLSADFSLIFTRICLRIGRLVVD